MGIDNLYRIVYIESKFLSEVIEMDISNTISTVKVSGSSSISVKKASEKNKWQLTDSLKEKIVELAKKDAKNNIYMGNEFMNLRKAEVAKVAPNRAALIGKVQPINEFWKYGRYERNTRGRQKMAVYFIWDTI